ncbi:MAG: sirohydrochlorin chelatase [Pirellula sp.]|nr:sirohydrochlorin chelatase [Pirellula sp.]
MFENANSSASVPLSVDSVGLLVERRLRALNAGVLIVGHGTRKPEGQRQLLQLTEQVAELLPGACIEPSFLELAEPDIAAGLSSLHARRCESIVVIPVLLFTAAHAKSDIPDAVADAAAKHGLRVLGQTASLEVHPSVLALSQIRFNEVLELPEGQNCPKGGCAAGEPPTSRCDAMENGIIPCPLSDWRRRPRGAAHRVALAMVGRGTSDPEALDKMRLLTRLRIERTPVAWSETGFFAGGKPNVDELMDQAAQSGCDTVIVQPHLLFEGELMDQLRAKVRARRRSNPAQSWWITRSLGADPALAEVFLQLLNEATAPLVPSGF